MSPDDPHRVAKISHAFRWLAAHDMDIATVMGACASVGIERSKDTASMIVDYVAFKESAPVGPEGT